MGEHSPTVQDCLSRLAEKIALNSTAIRQDILAISGCLDPVLKDDAAILLRGVAAMDLSLGRLIEGHVNAASLIQAWGTSELRDVCARAMYAGHLFGVWGADETSVILQNDRLTGSKRFASGLGIVTRAVVSARSPDGQRLVVVAADDPERQDLSGWTMSGMEASRSGRFDCEGLQGAMLGPPDVYTAEPYFLGGTWRIAAVTLGGVIGLLDRASACLRDRGRLEAEAQLLRLAPIAGRAVSAWPAILRVERAAKAAAEGKGDPERAAILSVSTRLLTEDLAQDAIAAVERSVGLSMFALHDPVGRAARDLACYVRQATRDAFSLKSGQAFLKEARLERWLDD